MICRHRASIVVTAASAFVAAYALTAAAQFRGEDAPLEVSLLGRVEAIYLNTDESEPTYVVEILVKKATSLRGSRDVPAGGETVFVVHDASSQRRPQLPGVGEVIQATVSMSTGGRTTTLGSEWFKPMQPDAARSSDTALVDLRGMECEAKIVSGQIAFEVKRVQPAGPASDAGFQVGDLITAVDDKPVDSVASLEELAAKSAPLELSVIDINTGRRAKVELAAMPAVAAAPSSTDRPIRANDEDSAGQIAQALGITVEPSRIGFRKTALVVSKVETTGAAKEAGIEVGDVLLAVDEQPMSSIDQFAAGLPVNGGNITLLVRDTRTGQDVPVEVHARPVSKRAATPKTIPSRASRRSAPAEPADALGLSTELTFYRAEAAVRIVSVERGSPAAQAGLEPGAIVLAVNGKPVMHPDELKSALSGAQGRIRLTLADPETNRETETNIER